jgi:HSP20 family protein
MNQWSLNWIDEMERLRTAFDRILGDDRLPVWNFPFSRISFLPSMGIRAYPLMNIGEDEASIYVDALAPGIAPDSINVSVTGDQLTISGQKIPLPGEVKPEDIHRSERSAGQFMRSISLNSTVERDKVQANYKDGMLRIVLPKSVEARPKQIQVTVA